MERRRNYGKQVFYLSWWMIFVLGIIFGMAVTYWYIKSHPGFTVEHVPTILDSTISYLGGPTFILGLLAPLIYSRLNHKRRKDDRRGQD